MNKIILLTIGITCTLLAALGIVWFTRAGSMPKTHLAVNTSLIPVDPETYASLSATKTTFDPQAELPSQNDPGRPFIVPGKIHINKQLDALDKSEADAIEKSALDYINKIIPPANKLKSFRAESKIELSPDLKLAKYTLRVYEQQSFRNQSGGFGYAIILKKTENEWSIIDARGQFLFRDIWQR